MSVCVCVSKPDSAHRCKSRGSIDNRRVYVDSDEREAVYNATRLTLALLVKDIAVPSGVALCLGQS